MEPRSIYLTLGGYEIHLQDWGDPENPAVICWHGLARTGYDFDTCAAALAHRYRVLCPDTLGRGLSAWAMDPHREYTIDFYALQAVDLIDQLGLKTVRWIGTSMGGILGMVLAGGRLKDRISHLVLNDIGPEPNADAVNRIKTYMADPPVVGSLSALESTMRTIYAPFGALSDREWRRMAETGARRLPDGRFTLHYDPAIGTVFTDTIEAFAFWEPYDAITARTLLLVGAQSDLITPSIVAKMQSRGPRPQLEVIGACGHAPYLNDDHQIGLLERFLAA